ncbi:MAG: tRNA lysidine(34) synthetase TilS [Armatimonadota bacterium]|nr:tRNA lysidine(34) synthetase TilS [Armatimonadota bacterium]
MDCLPNVLRAVPQYHMFSPGDRVLVAVSGGPDSVAMLHALHASAEKLGIALCVAHFNHCLRGSESDQDERFVAELAETLSLPCRIGRGDVGGYRKETGLGEEEAARELRYKFLHNCLSELHCNKLAVGHTADDRAETVLLNILRGTGLEGLASMRAVSSYTVRPLIETWRTEVIDYLHANGIAYRIDSSNLDVSYLRNRIRLQLLPLLEQDYNPQVKAALLRLGKLSERDHDALSQLASQVAVAVECGSVLDARLVSGLLPAVAAELIREEIQRVRGNLADITYEHIDRIVTAVLSGEDFAMELPGGSIVVEKRGTELRVVPCETSKQQVEPFEIELSVPGLTHIPTLGVSIDAQVLEKVRVLQVKPTVALLDAEKISGKLRVRNPRPGDRIRPFGMQGRKKLQDVFVDKKIPPSERRRAAVVVDDEKVLWVVGVTASEEARITEHTSCIIRLVAVPDQ